MKKLGNRSFSPVLVHAKTVVSWSGRAQYRMLWCVLLLSFLATSAWAEPGGAYNTAGTRVLRTLFVPIVSLCAAGLFALSLTNMVRGRGGRENGSHPSPENAPPASPPPLRKAPPRASTAWRDRAWFIVGFLPTISFSLCWFWLGLGSGRLQYTNHLEHMIETGAVVFAVSALVVIPIWSYLLLRLNGVSLPANQGTSSHVVKCFFTGVACTGANAAIVISAVFLYVIVAVLYVFVGSVLGVM